MAVSKISVTVPYEVNTVWNLVTDLTHFEWRSDIKAIKRLDELTFVEVSNEGYETVFHITKMEPDALWEFDLENSNMKGHFSGRFIDEGANTTLEFSENITPKFAILNLIVGIYLKKQQKQYIKDIEKGLSQYTNDTRGGHLS